MGSISGDFCGLCCYSSLQPRRFQHHRPKTYLRHTAIYRVLSVTRLSTCAICPCAICHFPIYKRYLSLCYLSLVLSPPVLSAKGTVLSLCWIQVAAQHEQEPQEDQSSAKARDSLPGCEPEQLDTDQTDLVDLVGIQETSQARTNPTQWHATVGNAMIEPEAKRWQLNPDDGPLKDCYNSTEELRADTMRLYGTIGSKICETGIQSYWSNSNDLGIRDFSKWQRYWR